MDARLTAYLASIGASPDCLDGWEVHTAQRSGVDVAFVAICGTEIHFVSLVGPKAMSRRNIAQYLGTLVEQYGYATTRTLNTETNHKLRQSLGFVPTHSDANYTYWALTKQPYAREEKGEPPCL